MNSLSRPQRMGSSISSGMFSRRKIYPSDRLSAPTLITFSLSMVTAVPMDPGLVPAAPKYSGYCMGGSSWTSKITENEAR